MKYKKIVVLMALGFMPLFASAQEVTKENAYFSNALFNSLLALIVILLIIILTLGSLFKTVANSESLKDKFKFPNKNGHLMGLVVLFSLAASSANAQEIAAAIAPSDDWLIGGLDCLTFYVMISIIAIESVVIYVLVRLLNQFLRADVAVSDSARVVAPKVKEKSIIDSLNASVDIEREHEILLDHNYDGIKELDNDLPPWWKYGFYLTVVVSFIYMIHFHVSNTGDLQDEEYKKDVVAAKLALAEYMKTSANKVDESTVKMLDLPADLEAGKQVYMGMCSVCHGKLGEGGVGPNMTDAYWLHSGGIADIFKSVKYGWPDKGMKSWKEDLSPMQIAQVSSFIKSLVGTNPPNAKAAQGDLYQDKLVLSDSTAVAIDSLKVGLDSLASIPVIKDTMKVKK